MTQRIQVIDSHTGGEPTRIIYSGGPDLGAGPLAERRERFRRDFDYIRSAVVNEPRGNDVLVGGLICAPVDPTCAAGVIFFNNFDYLGMCGHGMIGLMVTLEYLKRIQPGTHRIETPVGIVTAILTPHAEVTVENVPSYRYRHDVRVSVPNYGTVIGDVAWGGNWFFLVKDTPEDLSVDNTDRLLQVSRQIRDALQAAGITGTDGAWIDHVELFGPPHADQNSSRNFVLCPGSEYDRSPCGTGTSAKLACLAADKKLAPGDLWRQESIVGSVFTARYRPLAGEQVIPSITGSAYLCAETILILDPADPFCSGIRR